MTDTTFPHPAGSLGTPNTGSLAVTPQPAGGQGLSLTATGRVPNPVVNYQGYTPSLSSDGGGSPTLGNATFTARWARIGRFVHCYGVVTLGTITNFGIGNLLVAFPVPCQSLTVMVGNGIGFHAATSLQAPLTAISHTATTYLMYGQSTFNGTAAAVSGSAPFPWSWASGDNFNWNLTYEAAA